MKYGRSIWVLINLILATLFAATAVILVGAFDKRKRITGAIARFWAKWVMASTGVSVHVTGLENIDPRQQYIFVGNHESALDIPVAISTLPVSPVFLAKKELFSVPVFGWGLKAAGMVRVDRQHRDKAKESVDRAINAIRSRDVSVIIYPEGTRSMDDHLLPFKKGGFLLAVRSGIPVVPITILGAQSVVSKNSLQLNPGKITFIIDHPIPTDHMDDSHRDILLSQVRNIILHHKTEFIVGNQS